MSVRKKKTEKRIIEEVSKLVAEETLQSTDPVVVKVDKGSHLTVTYYSNGKTDLKWDDDALLRDVQSAIASVSTTTDATKKVSKSRRKKVND